MIGPLRRNLAKKYGSGMIWELSILVFFFSGGDNLAFPQQRELTNLTN